MGRVLMVVAQERFRDEELFETRAVLERAGHACEVASRSAGDCSGVRGGHVDATLALGAVDASRYDAVVFVGGPGAQGLFDDADAQRVAREAAEAGEVVAAICVAPVILANAGLLRGRRATAFHSELGALSARGAALQGEGVVVDGRIVTASGPAEARAFGRAISTALAGREAAPRAGDATVTPRPRARP